MNRIRLLPEQVANQIAAGEVIERPASVVKELVENALDAQATRLSIEVQAGGRSLIRVTDDGTGMSRDDALLCLERHATSKIESAHDLAAIRTMGFRGEAVPSIASVSRFTLTTREQESASPEGTRIVISGGKILEVKSAGSAPGTSVEVRQLFFNLPARRKFLRSEETEYAHINYYVTLAALAFPEVAFTLTHNGRMVRQLPAVRMGTTAETHLAGLRERLRGLMGGDQSLIAVDFAGPLDLPETPADLEAAETAAPEDAERGRARLWGFIGAPGVSRGTREDQHLFVNRRPVENRTLNYALLEAYHTLLMKGRYPVCCLFLELDPSGVDVNIHPAKREVKFHQDRPIRQFVTTAIRQALRNFHATAELGSALPGSPVPATGVAKPWTSPQPGSEPPALAGTSPAVRPAALEPTSSQLDLASPGAAPLTVTTTQLFQQPARAAREMEAEAGVPSPMAAPGEGRPPAPVQAPLGDARAPVHPLLSVPLRLVGVVGRLYVVLESDRGLVLLDQHAAHERILFEEMLHQMDRGGAAPSQRLLLPETIELSVRDAHFVRQLLPTLVRLGVSLSEFGERTFLLDALPPFAAVAHPRQFVIEMLDELREAGEAVNTARPSEELVARTVCRHAVKAHDPLQPAELEKLISDLRRCAMPYTCPHGRPTLIEMNFRELEKKFGRVV